MKIIVCIKQVPDTTEVKIDSKTGTLIREGIPSIINPDDKAGIEAAIQLKEKYDAHITVLCMGPSQAETALKEAYAMGADRVILLSDRAFAGSDTWATSLTLSYAIKKLDYDLIICGRQAIDGDTAQVGPQIAEHLNLPQVSYVTDIEKIDSYLKVKKIFEDGYQIIKIKSPCLITVLKEMNNPRYMTINKIFNICNKQIIENWTINDIDMDANLTGLKASPTQVKKIQTKSVKASGKVHNVEPQEGVKLIIDKLQEKFII
ncbi:MAG: electron transfer flavoprotein subunit beta/FixA family protein [Candidatus Cloacimonetes bacterium]|jgi:electron transfer flavoprotein beta subunit|nr:electron transfer flavoprotein subunit beta/FixA family protein [Candidatus Cloacimonadota bacterium]